MTSKPIFVDFLNEDGYPFAVNLQQVRTIAATERGYTKIYDMKGYDNMTTMAFSDVMIKVKAALMFEGE